MGADTLELLLNEFSGQGTRWVLGQLVLPPKISSIWKTNDTLSIVKFFTTKFNSYLVVFLNGPFQVSFSFIVVSFLKTMLQQVNV